MKNANASNAGLPRKFICIIFGLFGATSNAQVIYEDGYVVSTFAGTGSEGRRDGIKGEAQFHWPYFVALDKNGDMYVADFLNQQVRKITAADGVVHTVAGTGKRGLKDGPAHEAEFDGPRGIAIGPNGDIIVADLFNHHIRAFSPTTNTVKTIASGAAGLLFPKGVAVYTDGHIIVVDSGNHRIVKIWVEDGRVETVAGSGQRGFADGEARNAQFYWPEGIAVSSSGDIYVADRDNHRIRKICGRTRMVSTVAGTGNAGWTDGDAAASQFNSPRGVAVADDGCVYISDQRNHCIRKLDPVRGRVVTVAGKGESGFRDGDAGNALFYSPYGLAFGPDGVLYVADMLNERIRGITKRPQQMSMLVTTPPDEPESELENIEELEQKKQQMNELAQNILNATALTVATKEDLEKTKQATAQANKELVEAQNALKAELLALGAVLERRKELQMVNGEIDKMESTPANCDAGLINAEAELHEARRVLDMLTVEEEKYAQECQLVRAQLRRANKNDAGYHQGDVVEEKKESEESFEVTGETPAMASGEPALEKTADKDESPQVETTWSKQQPANEENVIADPLQRVEKKPEMHLDLVEKNSDDEQLQLNAAKAMAYEELPALEKEIKEKEARIEKALGLGKYASARGANTNKNEIETVKGG